MNNQYLRGGLTIFATICGYVLFNIAIIQSGQGIINNGLMNVLAGVITWIIFRKEVKSTPNWKVSGLQSLGILGIVFGLRWTHASLHDPSSTTEVVYDIFVVSYVGLTLIAEKPLRLPKTKIYAFDITLHRIMLMLVVSRVYMHNSAGWTLVSFLPAGVAVIGYWLFNISIRLSQLTNEKTRTTNIVGNMLGGSVIILISILTGGTANQLNYATIMGSIGVVAIVFFLGKAYKIFGALSLSPLVANCVYDGLLVCAPWIFTIVYGQLVGWPDVIITLGFVIVLVVRLLLYRKAIKGNYHVVDTLDDLDLIIVPELKWLRK